MDSLSYNEDLDYEIQQKKLLRDEMLKIRRSLSAERRESSAQDILDKLKPLLPKEGLVLSYASFGSELDTSLINRLLLGHSQLALPAVSSETLKIYKIASLKNDLVRSSYGMMEPIAEKCAEVKVEQLSAIVVPGVGFDPWNRRLGYGRGFYDRYLKTVPPSVALIGIGFKEQLLPCALPFQEHDVRLTTILVV